MVPRAKLGRCIIHLYALLDRGDFCTIFRLNFFSPIFPSFPFFGGGRGMINGSAVCFLDGGKLKGRRGEEEKKSKYIFNARQRDKKRPLKRGYLRYLAAAARLFLQLYSPMGIRRSNFRRKRTSPPIYIPSSPSTLRSFLIRDVHTAG